MWDVYYWHGLQNQTTKIIFGTCITGLRHSTIIAMTTDTRPAFRDREFLQQHIQFILDFYDERVVSPEGGFYQCFRDDGSVYNKNTRHLVSSTRFVYNYATAYRLYGDPRHKLWAEQGLQFLNTSHLQASGHYAWELSIGNNGEITISDGRAMAYGHAFVVLAAASCLQAGITSANTTLALAWELMETHFWEEKHQAYADERNTDLTELDPYRGQNANMHTCEACIAAFIATGETRYLSRAQLLAERFTIDLAAQSKGLIWEHYDSNWQVDMEYNIDKPDDLFKPWGFQPGHQVEWSKLLLQLNDLSPDSRWVTRACELFDTAVLHGWDKRYGGLVYGFAPDYSFCDSHKYFWVHAEAFAAAWRLHAVTGDDKYLREYDRIWDWSWQHLVDHNHGAWFRIRNRDGSAFDDLKSPPGKTDYHTLGACWDVLSVNTNN